MNVKTHILRNAVRCPESDPPDIVCQPIGILPHDLNTLIAISFIDLYAISRGNSMGLQENHDILDFLLLLPCLLDHLHPFRPNSFHLQQLIGFFLNNLQGVLFKLPDNPFCVHRTDALDQSAAEILFDPCSRSRKLFLKRRNDKLAPVFGIHLPLPFQGYHGTDIYRRHISHNGDQIKISRAFHFGHGITIFIIYIGNPLNDS